MKEKDVVYLMAYKCKEGNGETMVSVCTSKSGSQ